ncbi:MAG: endonuclease V [Spirochaetes bacterium]|nr:endonuclease V [Spirochaetota bacterium]
MRILLCNDDGVTAQGIVALYDALVDSSKSLGGPLGEVFVVAPLTVQSATGHGVTFREPLMVAPNDVNERMSGIAVDGRPADCVKLALAELWPAKFGAGTRPDLVISGMNMGANVGINVLYSGTCAAAIEAAFLGVPSIGCAKSRLFGRHDEPGRARGDRSVLSDDEGVPVGLVLRTRTGVKPVFVSPGHRVGIEEAGDIALACAGRYRVPEPTRLADIRVEKYKREYLRTCS